MSLRIRAARAADAAAIQQLEREFPGDRMSRRSIRHLLRAPTAAVYVAEAAGAVVGNLFLLTRKGSATARIYSVVVAHAARGHGVGALLVASAERNARRRGCRAIALEVRADNGAARALYEKLGYAVAARLPSYYEDGGAGLRLRKGLSGRAGR